MSRHPTQHRLSLQRGERILLSSCTPCFDLYWRFNDLDHTVVVVVAVDYVIVGVKLVLQTQNLLVAQPNEVSLSLLSDVMIPLEEGLIWSIPTN